MYVYITICVTGVQLAYWQQPFLQSIEHNQNPQHSMEKSKQNDVKLLAIMQFIHYYDQKVSLSTLFNGVSFYKLIACIPASQFNFDVKVNEAAEKWLDQLQNLQNILLKVQEYFEEVHQKSLNTTNIDLLNLTKKQDEGQLIKYFQLIMAVLMESSHKEYFVQSIMMLQESSQEIFVEIVKNSLQSHQFTKSKYRSNLFERLMVEFNQQKQKMEKEIERLCKANADLLLKLRQYEETISQIQLNQSSRKMEQSISYEEGKNTKYLEEYIDRLQNRLLEQEKSFQEEKMHNLDRIEDLQAKVGKMQETEELCRIYKEKYDDIMDQMQKMNIWKRQKAKMEKCMEEKDFMVQKLHDRIEELTQKNLLLEQTELEMKLEIQKKELKIQKMSHELKKVMENIGNAGMSFSCKINETSTLDQNLKQCTMKSHQETIFSHQQQSNQMKKQNEKQLKKIKQLQKQLCKLTKRLERLRMLEDDKTKLQQLVFQLRTAQNEELNLIFAIFFEGFEQNLEMSRKMRQEVLQFKDTSEIIKKPKNQRRGSSILALGKQNWKKLSGLGQ